MDCKIVPVKRTGKGYISFSILANPGWQCVPHHIYFGTNEEEARPKKCPMFKTRIYKPKKKK